MPRTTRFARFADLAWTFASLYASYRFAPRKERPGLHRANAERLLELALRLQGLMIKIGQWIATRADLLPDEYVEVLSELHDRVPPRPFAVIRPHVERCLGRRLDEVFRRFEPEPIAAASLAQVHEAELHDGRRVAVKVQYPEIEAFVAADVRNLRLLLRIVRRIQGRLDFVGILNEVHRYVSEELDFEHEGRNAEAIGALYTDRDDVAVPRIVWEWSSRRVLVMEFVDGIKVTDVSALRAAGIDPGAVAERLLHVYAEQILRHGLFHADPHPGNVLVRRAAENGRPRLVFLDFGVVKRLPETFRRGLAEVLLAVLRGQPAEALAGLGRIGFRTRNNSYEDLVPLTGAVLRFAGEKPERIADAELLERFGTEILRAYRQNPVVRIPEDILLVMRVLGILGGIEKQLGGHFDLIHALLPYAKEGAAGT